MGTAPGSRRFFLSALAAAALLSTVARPSAAAEEPSAATSTSELEAGRPITAPRLTAPPDPTYPAGALRDRIEGNVGLELAVDETGAVTDAKVVVSAGPDFDAAAVAAARRFVFQPARDGATAISATVQFTCEFHLPPLPAPPQPTAAASPAAKVVDPIDAQVGPDQSTLVTVARPSSAASSTSVRDREFTLRPINGVQDILRVTPGLVVVQHAGGGKANQYFLRGFDADHGTDLALSIDGVPINMVSHAHGQGYSDTNFIIPEVVERVEITKGPYFAQQGDFATAGAVNLVARDGFEHSAAAFGLSASPGHGGLGYRGLVIASPTIGGDPAAVKATFAAEIGRSNGPFDNPEGWDRYKLFNKLTLASGPTSSLSLTEMSYAGNWHGSGQLPSRAVDQGLVSRFGSIDPDEGGNTARHQLALSYRLRPTETGELRTLVYLGSYRFNLFSNFTLALRDPVNGDEIEQIDRRTFYGGKASYRVVHQVGALWLETSIGGELRSDDIHAELWNTVHRLQVAGVRDDDVHQTMIGAFVNQSVIPARWLRLDLGGRADLLSFAVDSTPTVAAAEPPRGGIDDAHRFSPKASLILTPLARSRAQLDVYVNYGHGFHSNDVRGAFATPSVTPLTRAVGEEVGSRARLFGRWDLAVALWRLQLDHETVWSGDQGTTLVSDATSRRGLELETRFELTPWLAADLDLTFTKSRFSADRENGGGLALAPKRTWSGGLSGRRALGAGVARAALRFYGIADRPATDDGALVAPGFTEFDLHLGYRHRWFDIAFDIENLLNSAFRSAQFATVGRLSTEPAIGSAVPAGFSCGRNARLAPAASGAFQGCEDIHFTPAYPLTARIMATVYFD